MRQPSCIFVSLWNLGVLGKNGGLGGKKDANVRHNERLACSLAWPTSVAVF